MNKQGELLTGSKRSSPGKRIISTLLVLCMLFGLLPASALAADTTASSGAASAGSDAFGIATKGDLSTEEKKEEAKSNPYGTENWFNLFPVSELHIASGDSSGRSFDTHNYNVDGETGSIGDAATGITSIGYKKESQGNDGFRMMDTAGCDALGEGQKRYVATIAYWEGGDTIQLFLADKDGNRVSNELKIGSSKTVEYLEAVEAHQTTGFLSVACGDFDGDGVDSIVAYFPEMEGGNPHIWSYPITQKDGSFQIGTGAAVESSLWGIMETGNLSERNSKNSKVRNNTPLVQLVADDTDKDGVDELVVTTSISSTSANDVNNRGSRLFVYDYCVNDKNAYTWKRSASMALQAEDHAWAAGRLRWASSSVGNVIQNTTGGADFPEIVSAGYYDHTQNTATDISDSDSKTNLAVYIASCTKVTTDQNGNQIGNYAQTATNLPIKASGFVRGGLYTGDDVQSLVPVQTFAARGVNYADYILVADTVYSYENGALSEKYREGYFSNDDDGIGACVITNGLVQDVTAGNFDGNVNGVEQVVFTTMQKRSGRNDYFSKIYTYQLKNESWQKDETGYLTDCAGNAYLSLCAFDCDKDGTIVKYKEASRTYTDPEVLALLEATPYFSEKDGGDIGNSATSYGTMNADGSSSSYSNSLTTNVVAGFEWGVDDITAGFACGAGFEATVENNFTWSTEEEQYESYSLTYSNDTGDNMVIVYRRPVITYCYEAKSSGKLHTVSKEGTLATSMIPVDRYNEIAAQNGMDLISDSVLSTPGNPFSYRSTLPEGAVTKNSDKQQYSGTGTVEQSFTKGSTITHSYDYELNTSFNAYGLVFGVKAGGGAGYAHTESTSTMNTTEITKAGAVTCNGTAEYDFQWQFAYWDTKVNGNTVPVLGYVVTDPVAPPSPPSNLSADKPAADSFDLHWTAGSRPADEYRIYRVLDDTNAEPVQVATVDGTETACTLSSLKADTTYTYIVKAYAAQGEGISSRGLSVASESLTITTPPEGAEAPTISGPDNVGAKVGETASFTVNVVLPDKYGSVSYQWQQRKNASGWRKVSDSSTGKTLKLTNVTEEMDGTEYRCALTASYADGSPTYYYSGVGKLTVGRTSVNAELGIASAIGGDGSIATPYTGAANYQKQTGTETKTVLVETPVIIQKSNTVPELTVYQVGTEPSAKYVGIGTIDTAGTADDKTVYYEVTKSGESYTVGDQLTLTQYEYLKIDKSAYGTMPTFDSTKPVSKTVDNATYLLMATVTGGTTNTPITIPEGSKVEGSTAQDTRLTGFGENPTVTLHWYNGGKYYAYGTDGSVGTEEKNVTDAYDVYLNDAGKYVLGRSEIYTVASTEGTETIYEDETGYWFYHVTMDEAQKSVTCVQQSAKEALSNGVSLSQLTALTKKVMTTVESPVYTTQSGTTLSLTAAVTDSSSASASGATVDFRIVNTSTGATATVTAATNSSGTATAAWTAPATGLYSVRAVVQDAGGYAGTESAPQYYYAGATAPSENDTIKEYQLTLKSGSTPLAGEMDYAADSVISIATLSRTVSATDPGKWETVTKVNGKSIVYTVTAPDGKPIALSGTTAFTPSRAGVFSIKAYADSVSTENLLAAATLQVRRVSVTVKPTWAEGTIPTSLDGITATAEPKIDLKDVFTASCDLYGKDGNQINGKSGRFTVSLAYQNNDAAKNFTNCYSVNLQSDVLIVQPNSANVFYEWGENGTMQGRYGENCFNMSSGHSIIAGTELQFTATPNAGYQVDQWIINGKPMNKEKPVDGYTLSGNTLTIPSFTLARDTVEAGEGQTKSLTVQVTFASSKNEITFGVTKGSGKLSAVSGRAPLTTGNSVALGATVTFTATPATNKVVKEWLVDGEKYTWPGTAETYRGNTLRLDNISAGHTVYVSFQNGASYNVTTSVYNEEGNAQPALATITAKNAETGVGVDLTKIPSGTTLTFTATLASPSNNTVKEWQYKTSSGSFVTVAGSGGQSSFTFYNLSSDTEVRAIVTSAQSFQLNFGIQLGDQACTDNTIASLIAKSNGTPVTAGSQPAYIPVDFALTLSDNYRVVEWSNNVIANTVDKCKASLASLLGTTGKITVTIEEKPQVNVAADKNGTTTVIGTLMANNDQPIAAGETKHVEKDSTISVTATPDKGWYVDSITIGSEKVFDEAATNYVPDAKTVQESNITADTTVTVAYAQKPTVTITANDNITVTTKTDITEGYVEKYSDPITFTATPATGYETNVWTVNDNKVSPQTTTSDETTYTYPAGAAKVTENITVSVTSKAIPQYNISYAVVDTKNTTDGGNGFNGKVSLTASRKDMYVYKVNGKVATNATVVQPIYRDSTVTLTAAANAGYRVKHWLVGGKIYTKNSVTYSGTELKLENLSEAKTVQVEFEKSTDQTTISATTGGSIVSAKVGATQVNVNGFKLSNNATVDIVAAADEGYELVGWTVNSETQPGATELSFSFTSNNSSTGSDIVAVFASDRYAVTYEVNGGNGTLAADFGDSGTPVKGGTSVTFTASPTENYAVKSWTVNDAKQTETSNQLTLSVTEKTRVTVEFARSRYVVTFDPAAISATVGGQAIQSGAAVAKGSDVAFTAQLTGTNIVKNWITNDVSDDGTEANPSEQRVYTLTNLGADTEVRVVTMENPSYQITYSAGDHGSVSIPDDRQAASPVTALRHSKLTFAAAPVAYYQVDAWTVNGTPVTRDNAASLGVTLTAGKDGVSLLTVNDLTAGMTIAVSFKEAVRYNVKFSADTTNAAGTIAATSNGQAINTAGTAGIDLIGGSTLVFTAAPTYGDNMNNTTMVCHWTVNCKEIKDNLSNELELTLAEGTEVVVSFEAYEGYAIPTSQSGYVISHVLRTPSDTNPTTQIRKGGTVSFRVSPDGELKYSILTKLTVSGYDCLTGTGDYDKNADKVAAVRNTDGSYTVTVTGVKAKITTDIETRKLVVGDITVPEELKENEDLNTEAKLQTKLNVQLTGVGTDNRAYYDIALKYWTGTGWDNVDAANFPASGVDVLLGYPTGTDKTNTFTIVHMFTTTSATHNPGDTEVISNYQRTDEGILFHVSSLSPFALGWAAPGGNPGGGGGGGGATSYTLTFETNGGSKIKSASAEAGTVIELTEYRPVREGYSFVGWCSDAALTQKITTVTLEKSLTIYAKWTKGSGVDEYLNTDDHIAYMSGYNTGEFGADNNMTRAEVAMMFYRLLKDRNAGDAKSFPDVDGTAWYGAAVEKLAGLGIISGYSDGSFQPGNTISRAEFVTIASRFAALTDADCSFYDVPKTHWAYDYIAFASSQGWISGYSDGTFGPSKNITRAEVTKIVNSMLGRQPDETYIDSHSVQSFTDLAKIHWAYYEIMEAANAHTYTKSDDGQETWSALK